MHFYKLQFNIILRKFRLTKQIFCKNSPSKSCNPLQRNLGSSILFCKPGMTGGEGDYISSPPPHAVPVQSCSYHKIHAG